MLRVPAYFGLSMWGGRMTVEQVVACIDARRPVMMAIQAYRESNQPYRECWGDGHWATAIGYEAGGGWRETGGVRRGKGRRNSLPSRATRPPPLSLRIIFEDPSSYKRTWLAAGELLDRWHDLDAGGKRIFQWGCYALEPVRFRPGEMVHMD
jgi:hypothetical protein